MPHFVNFKKVEIFKPLLLRTKKTEIRLYVKPGTICKRRWRWIGHVLGMPLSATAKVALYWTPDGKRKRGRPKETWRRTLAREMKERGWSWNFLEIQAKDRLQWRSMVEALCSSGGDDQ